LWPIINGGGTVSSEYGNRPRVFNRQRLGPTEFHSGIDIAAPRGTRIVAAYGGTVIAAGWRSGYGNTVEINHGNGLTTMYAHNHTNLVRVGQVVARGEVIAHVGSTGNSTGPHLHFEVRVNGAHVNPWSYLR
jgi:murein DD-endopeptidase MepM/ murein hydrolase activator NlpD